MPMILFLALYASSGLSYRAGSRVDRLNSPVAAARTRYANAGDMYYDDAGFYSDDNYIDAKYDAFMMYEEAAENLERAERKFSLMSRFLDEQQLRAQGGEVAEKDEFVWFLWYGARQVAKSLAKRAIKWAITKAVKEAIKRWVKNKLGKTLVKKATKKAIKDMCKKYFKKYKALDKVRKRIKKRVKKRTQQITEAMADAETEKKLEEMMNADSAKLEAELEKESVQQDISSYVEKELEEYIDSQLKTSWAGLLPVVGEIELGNQMYTLLATDAVKNKIDATMEEKLKLIADSLAPELPAE